jgi:murein DD-endopeptidase MepM/ murein hydrolase activator NlpD
MATLQTLEPESSVDQLTDAELATIATEFDGGNDLRDTVMRGLEVRQDRRKLLRSVAAKAAGGALLAAFGLAAREKSAAAWSFNPSTYTTPIAFQCYPVTQWYGTGSHVSGENAKAIDIGCRSGTPVYAPKSGTIAFEGWEGVGGIVCRINHSDGCQSILAHLSSTIVDAGWWVQGGYTKIGYSGATGQVSGPHLHWALRVNGGGALNLDSVPGVSRYWICP